MNLLWGVGERECIFFKPTIVAYSKLTTRNAYDMDSNDSF